ncbi:MAG: prepilin-type N-terminal cleavage/methylation domain-containing protein [Ruthenibacterium sp.]
MKNKKGFTLIELIVVLAILAVIAAIAVPTAFGSIEKAQIAADTATVDSINSAIRMEAILEKADAANVGTATVAQAIEHADMSNWTATVKPQPQHKTSSITWVDATDKTIGQFTYASTGKDVKATWDAMVKTALTGKADTVNLKKTTTP